MTSTESRPDHVVPSAPRLAEVAPVRLPWSAAFTDAAVVAKRTCCASSDCPKLLVFVTVQPVMFVLLFRYVFGGAIHVAHGNYVDYVIPGGDGADRFHNGFIPP